MIFWILCRTSRLIRQNSKLNLLPLTLCISEIKIAFLNLETPQIKHNTPKNSTSMNKITIKIGRSLLLLKQYFYSSCTIKISHSLKRFLSCNKKIVRTKMFYANFQQLGMMQWYNFIARNEVLKSFIAIVRK